jgi:hypothetical protein
MYNRSQDHLIKYSKIIMSSRDDRANTAFGGSCDKEQSEPKGDSSSATQDRVLRM